MKKILLIFIIFLLCGCGYDKYKVPKEVNIKATVKTFDVFSEHIINEVVQIDGAKLVDGNLNLNTNKIGTHKITISYKYKKRTYKYDVKYIIKDKISPVFISASSIITTLKNDDLYPCDDIVFADNYDRIPTCEINGEYDLTKTGVYNVEYVLRDNSKNETRKKLKINVVDKISNKNNSSNNSTKKRINISNIIDTHKNENTMIGIDVSRWQGNIDWQKVKDAGVEFVIMRIGVQSGAKKDIEIDSYYKQNIKGAKEVGLKVGVYVYSTAINNKIAKDHAKWVINILDGIKLDFPIAFDWENWPYFMEYKISLHDLSSAFITFEKEVKKYGYEAMLYSSKFYLENIWMNPTNAPVWLAHYTSKTTYKDEYIMWQLTAIGEVDGINGDVDIDIYYKEK